MEQVEEERRQKEERNFQELLETIALDSAYFNSRDLQNKGKDVHPSAKQRKQVQDESAKIKFAVAAKRKQGNVVDDGMEFEEIDLKAKPRVFVMISPVNKYEPENLLRKFNRRFLIVFTDVVLVANKKDTSDYFEVTETYWVKDLRLKYTVNSSTEDRFVFELLVNRGRNRPRLNLLFTCDSDSSWKQVVEDLENTLLAYHKQTEFAKSVGWFHDIIQGNIFSAAYLGDIIELRKHIRQILDATSRQQHQFAQINEKNMLDEVDMTGMTALHWAALRGHEVCVRLLLDKGAEVDVLQQGMNSPLLLAAAGGHETVARLLLERGADISLRNVKGHDAVFMAVLYGHATKGLPWLLQLLTHRGLDLNQVDSCGATPLHLCAEKNLARPVRMLVDAGADVNAKYGASQWSPLQLACKHRTPDVETIRSFLDKGAYPNWKDLQGKTAFEIALSMQPSASSSGSNAYSNNANSLLSRSLSDKKNYPTESIDETGSNPYSEMPSSSSSMPNSPDKWRAMDETLSQVGDWAVRALPALLELGKKGARFETRELEFLRPSFRSAVQEARDVWLSKTAPPNFKEFVSAREQAGEELRLHKGVWHKDTASSTCPLCSDGFGLTNRRHHCRACGVLCCDKCSSKRLQLSDSADFSPTVSNSNSSSNNSSGGNNANSSKEERVCDGCFNRLCHEASQPSPDHFRVRQLKQCALDAIQSIEELIDSLDDPYGESHSLSSAVVTTPPNSAASSYTSSMSQKMMSFSSSVSVNTTSLSSGGQRPGSLLQSTSFRSLTSPSSSSSKRPSSLVNVNAVADSNGINNNNRGVSFSSNGGAVGNRSSDMLIDALKQREAKLYRAEDIVAKFLEAADGYHRVSKKLIEQKTESKRLWGNGGTSS